MLDNYHAGRVQCLERTDFGLLQIIACLSEFDCMPLDCDTDRDFGQLSSCNEVALSSMLELKSLSSVYSTAHHVVDPSDSYIVYTLASFPHRCTLTNFCMWHKSGI